MNDMVNSISPIQTQSPATPTKNVVTSNESSVSGNQPVKPEQQRQSDAVNEPQEKVEKRLDQAVEQLNSFIQQVQRDLNFQVDELSGKTVVTVLNTETKEVIRQIPSEDVLNRIHNLEDVQGLLFKDRA